MKKVLKFFKRLIENFWIRLIFMLGCVVGIFALGGAFESSEAIGAKILEIITSGDVVSIFLVAAFSLIVADIAIRAMHVLEESLKIEDDHHKIICKYSDHKKTDVDPERDLYDKDGVFMYLSRTPEKRRGGKNPERDKRSDAYKKREAEIVEYTKNGKLYLPSVSVFTNTLGDTDVVFKDDPTMFELPVFVRENMLKLMEAHKASNVSNSVTVRLNDISCTDNVLTLDTARSQYFDMLATNRCMDYRPDGNISVRDVYEFDSKVTPLERSALGNQIGINGLIVTNDGYLLLEKRGRKKTTWKDKFAQPISLAMKLKDTGIGANDKLGDTPEAASKVFKKIITGTIKKNFGLTENELVGFDMRVNFMGIARDLLEGGKPNMYFYVMVDMSGDELKKFLQRKSEESSAAPIAESDKHYPKVTSDKLDSDYYLVHHSDIKIDYNYELKLKAKKIKRVKRRYAPCVGKFKQATDGGAYAFKRAFGGSIKKECGEALLACLYFSDACSQRIRREQQRLKKEKGEQANV